MEQMRIEAYMVKEEGNIVPLAQHLLAGAMAFFADPENEKEFQEWKKAREARKGA
jgi:hypothetical protein